MRILKKIMCTLFQKSMHILLNTIEQLDAHTFKQNQMRILLQKNICANTCLKHVDGHTVLYKSLRIFFDNTSMRIL